MKQIKRREPVTLSPEISTQRCLVFNKKGEILPVFGIVNLTISSDESTEDAPHASFHLRIRNLSHNNKALMLTGLSAGALQYCNKNPRAQDSGISLWHRQGILVVARTLPYTVMTLSNSLCKYITKTVWKLFLLAEISNFDYKVTII